MLGRFERRHEPLMSGSRFALRILGYIIFALGMDMSIIFLGALGFHYIESLDWLDAVLNTAMIITGNGPPYQAHTEAGKVFQIAFGVLGVILFVLVVSVILAPVLHRVLHAFSIEAATKDKLGIE